MRTIKNIDAKDTAEKILKTKLLIAQISEKAGNNISRNGKKKLPFKKLKYIADNFYEKSLTELSEFLCLGKVTISQYARELGLTTLYLSPEDIPLCSLMILLTGKYTNSYVLYLIRKFNIPIIRENKKMPYIINIQNFYAWYHAHLKLIRLDKYEIGTLPDEPGWFVEKAKADKRAAEYTYKRHWTQKEDNLLKSLVENRATYFECSKILKRTGNAIKRRCYDLAINKPKRTPPVLWADEQIAELRKLWFSGYEPCVIAEEIGRSDREITGILERYKYFGEPPQKYTKQDY